MQLCKNHRAGRHIEDLSNSVLGLLMWYFPEAVDKLQPTDEANDEVRDGEWDCKDRGIRKQPGSNPAAMQTRDEEVPRQPRTPAAVCVLPALL